MDISLGLLSSLNERRRGELGETNVCRSVTSTSVAAAGRQHHAVTSPDSALAAVLYMSHRLLQKAIDRLRAHRCPICRLPVSEASLPLINLWTNVVELAHMPYQSHI